ncbi:MAG: dihydrodipicolinate reductase [Candidatus Methanomethylicia archaeon]
MSENFRVVVYGLGPIGALIARSILKKRNVEIVGGVDIAPDKVGRDLGEVIGLGKQLGVNVVHDSDSLNLLLKTKPHVVLHSTATYLDKIYPQIVKCIRAGVNVISTSETLAYPWYRYPELATLIDEMAKKYCVRILGTGVNPGFIFDTLPAFLSSVCIDVEGIHIVRSIDASKRRYSFQKKYGLSMTVQEFQEKISRGEITAHVGYAESIMLISCMLDLKIDKIIEGQEPIVADKYMETQYFKIQPGQVCGIRGYGTGYVNNKEFIKLELLAAVGRTDYDEVVINGEPPLKWRNEYGTAGDIATAAMIINVIPRVLKAPPGLLTMKDIAIPSSYLGVFRC